MGLLFHPKEKTVCAEWTHGVFGLLAHHVEYLGR